MTNTDGDAVNYDFLDQDSDNDGITDAVEAQATIGFISPSGSDADDDGMDDAYDPDCTPCGSSGTYISPENTDAVLPNSDTLFDYMDTNSDGDAYPDYEEANDINNTGYSFDDLVNWGKAHEAKSDFIGYYAFTTDVNLNGTPDWLEASGSTLNFLDPGSGHYRDSDFDGLVDLFDGDTYGTNATAPDNNGNGSPEFRDAGLATPLPVTLLSFTASFAEKSIRLEWQTATEINSDYFTIEKSKDGNEFEHFAEVSAAGNSTQLVDYELWDDTPYRKNTYYRLSQTDYDGTTEYFDLIQVNRKEVVEVTIYPNPVKEVMTLNTSNSDTDLQYQLYDMSGAVKLQGILQAASVQVNVGQMEKGIYFLHLVGDGVNIRRKVVLQ